ncbi:MAG: ATP-dependent Clp protease ATP-binding subunit [Candidatus Yanofskybacteria bacterium]|nr:ATP-dependent Clp protease ATP-binding subunit [Candidatus Yanofskybacteria bacterium]
MAEGKAKNQLPTPSEMEAFLKKNLKGQTKAIEAVVRQYELFHSGLKDFSERDKERPIGVFLFLGPSGVGKTEIGRLIAKLFHGSRKALTKIDLEGYKEKHNVARLIGAPPGYIGHDELPEFSMQKLYAVIPGMKKPVSGKSAEKPKPEQKSSNEGPKVMTLGPIESIDFQNSIQSLKIGQLSLILEELHIIEESASAIQAEIDSLMQVAVENKKTRDKSMERLEVEKYYLDRLNLRKRQLIVQYLIILNNKWASEQKEKEEVEAAEKAAASRSEEKQVKEYEPDQKTKEKEDDEGPVLIIILDEIEKAHPDIHNFFLNVFDEGIVSLANGEKTDLRKAFIFMTSNIAAKSISTILQGKTKKIGFVGQGREDIPKIAEKELKKTFNQELLNRIDETVTFEDLSEEQLKGIFEINLSEFAANLKENWRILLDTTEEVKTYIVKRALEKPEGQARSLLEEFRRLIKIPLNKLAVDKKIKTNQIIRAKLSDNKIVFVTLVLKKNPSNPEHPAT